MYTIHTLTFKRVKISFSVENQLWISLKHPIFPSTYHVTVVLKNILFISYLKYNRGENPQKKTL